MNNLNEWKASNKNLEDRIISEQYVNDTLSTNLHKCQSENLYFKTLESESKVMERTEINNHVLNSKYLYHLKIE